MMNLITIAEIVVNQAKQYQYQEKLRLQSLRQRILDVGLLFWVGLFRQRDSLATLGPNPI